MCILFSYVSKLIKPGEFKLIILNNRDEYFHRPAKAASFVNTHCLYGQDLTQGKEGGTWLGLSKLGKISTLLNLDRLDYADDDLNKAGRGFMIPNYLNASLDSNDYVDSIIKSNDKRYNPFNLVFFEKTSEGNWNASVYDNYTSNYKKIDSEFFCISNHLHTRPYPKTMIGEKKFQNVINQFNQINLKQKLVENLFEFAKYDAGKKFDDVKHLGEKAIRDMMQEQVCINIPNYGTRTHSIILVDSDDKVTYIEKTLDFPIDESNKKWTESVFEFELI